MFNSSGVYVVSCVCVCVCVLAQVSFACVGMNAEEASIGLYLGLSPFVCPSFASHTYQ